MNSLAVVIPAYKLDFLDRALESINAQTFRDFHVYIGDDASPHDLRPVVEKWEKRGLPVTYRRFDTNLGGSDLVGQWTRCVDMTGEEPWIWLFSDDDMMEPDCVEKFISRMNADHGRYDIYHFDVTVIDSQDAILKNAPAYPAVIRPAEYFRRKMNAEIESFVVENIFSRAIYKAIGGFKRFPMAWGSDVATWMAMMQQKGMATIKGPRVLWRSSDQNITPLRNPEISRIKLMADIDLIISARDMISSDEKDSPVNMEKIFIRQLIHYSNDVDRKTFLDAVNRGRQAGIIGRRISSPLRHSFGLISLLRRLRHSV